MTISDYIQSILWLVLLNIASFQTGSLLLNSLIRKRVHIISQKLISLSLGFVILTYITMLMGFLQLYSSKIFLFVILSLILINIKNLKKIKLKFAFKLPKNKIEIISLIIVIITFTLLIIKSLEPRFLFDSLVYHLKIPILYLENGGIFKIPYFLFSNMPHNIEIFYTLILSNATFWAVKLWVLECLIILFILFTRLANLFFNSSSPYLNALIVLGSANLWQHMPYCYIEPAMSLFLLISILFLYLWIKERKNIYLIILAIFWGFLMGCKYTLWLLTFPFWPIIMFFMIKNKFSLKKQLITILIITIIILSLLSPWLIKNYIYTQNPIYPNINKIFHSPYWSDILDMQLKKDMSKNENSLQKIISAITLPYDLTFNKKKYNSDPFSPLLLSLFIFSVFFINKLELLPRITLIFCLSSIFVWFIFPYSNEGRFLLPLLPVMGLVSINLQNKITKNRTLYLLLFIFSLIILFLSSKQELMNIEIPFNKQKYNQIISQNDNYEACDFFNKLKKNSKIFFLFENRLLFLKKKHLSESTYGASTSMHILRQCKTNKNFYIFLKKNKFTHVAINPYSGGTWYFNNKATTLTHKHLYSKDMMKQEKIRLQIFFSKYCQQGIKVEPLIIFELK